MRLRFPIWALTAIACAPSVNDTFPADDLGGAMALLDVPDPATPSGVVGWVFDGASVNRMLALDYAEPRYALAYSASIAELAWRRGRFEHDPNGTSRPRRPQRIYERREDEWVDISDTALAWPALSALRVAWPEDRCGAGPACFDEGGMCVACAPLSPVALPRPPEPWPVPDCPEGIDVTSETIAGHPITRCAFPRPVSCGAHARATIDARCLAIGRPCETEADGWPARAPSGPLKWVHVTGSPAGDGTRARPWDLSTALVGADAGDTLVVSSGSHTTTESARVPLTIVGACAAETSIELPSLYSVSAARLRVEDASVNAARLEVHDAGRLELDGVRLGGDAFVVGGSTLSATDTLFEAVSGRGYRGIYELTESELRGTHFTNAYGKTVLSRMVSSGRIDVGEGELRVDATAVEASKALGVGFAGYGSSVFITRVAVFGGLNGLRADGPGSLELSDSSFEAHEAAAVIGDGMGLRASLDGIVMRGSDTGVTVNGGVEMNIRHLATSAITGDAIHVETATGSPRVAILDLLVEDAGDDAVVVRGGELSLERAVFDNVFGAGVHVLGPADKSNSSATLVDVTLRRTHGAAVDLKGTRAFSAAATLERVLIVDGTGSGINARDGRGRLTIRDLTIRGLSAEGPRNFTCIGGSVFNFCEGTGVLVRAEERPVELDLSRFDIEGVAVGLAIGAAEPFHVTDGRVRGEIGFFGQAGGEWENRLEGVRLDSTTLLRTEAF